MSKIFGLVGAGGYGRETINFIKNKSEDFEVYFIDKNVKSTSINGIKVVNDDEFLSIKCEEKFFNVSVSDPLKRKAIADQYISSGVRPIELDAKTFVNQGENNLDDGSIFSDYTILSPNVEIGKFFHCNRLSHIAHDVKIGDYVTFAPQANCNGNTIIEDLVYLGTSCILRQGSPDKPLRIGKGAVIGMGAVVTKDVEPYTTMIGNPARILEN